MDRISSASDSDIDVSSVESTTGDLAELSLDLKAEQPEAVQWMQADIDERAPHANRDAYLRQRVRRIFQMIYAMRNKKTQRGSKGKKLHLAKFLAHNRVSVNAARLRRKATDVLRSLYAAAQRASPETDQLLRSLEGAKESKPDALDLFQTGLRLQDPTRNVQKLNAMMTKWRQKARTRHAVLVPLTRDALQELWATQAKIVVREQKSLSFAASSGPFLSGVHQPGVPQPEPAVSAAEVLPVEEMQPVPSGHIAYASSEWFWVLSGPEAAPRRPLLLPLVSKWEGVKCPKNILPSEFRARIIEQRRQKSLEGSSDVPQLGAEELIAHASTSLQNEVAFLTRDQSIQFARYFHDEDAMRYNQRLDERRTKL